MLFRSLALAISVLLIVPACAKSSAPSMPALPPNLQAPQTSGEIFGSYFADPYALADSVCQNATGGGGTIAQADLAVWQDGGVTTSRRTLRDTVARPQLSGAGIGLVVHGLYQQTDCGSAGSSSTCPSTAAAKVLDYATPLNICDTTRKFDRISIEGVALTSMAMIENAYAFYNTIDGHLPNLPQSTLVVLPKVETLYLNGAVRSAKVDNLAYVPDFAGSPSFVIFPKGAYSASLGRWTNVNLWEIPWTLAHEFGHHIFRNHSGLEDSTSGLEAQRPFHAIPTQDDSIAPTGFALASAQRKVTDADLLGAVNEGYADLFAYYAYGGKPGMTKGIDCFHDNRDAGLSKFANGDAKAFSANVLAQFLSTTPAPLSGDCALPYYQDIHTIGAIFAYGVDQIFSASAGQDAAKKAALLLTWAKHVGDSYHAAEKSGVPLTIGALAHAALLTVASGNTLPSAACTAATAAFPTYAEAWFPGEFSCK